MKKVKLNIIRVESFITNIDAKEKETIKGGMNHADTSIIQHCTPHGSIQTCPSEYNCNPIERLTFATVRRTIWSFCPCN